MLQPFPRNSEQRSRKLENKPKQLEASFFEKTVTKENNNFVKFPNVLCRSRTYDRDLNASAVKIYSATSSLLRLGIKMFSFT
jgi:hypothetical protein